MEKLQHEMAAVHKHRIAMSIYDIRNDQEKVC